MSSAVPNDEFAKRVHDFLLEAFPKSHVVIGTAYGGAYSVKIVGPEFNELEEEDKQTAVWTKVRNYLKEEAQNIRWIVVYGDDDL